MGREYPTVLVDMSTPYFKGRVWAVAVQSPPFSLLIGNHVTMEDGEVCDVSTDLPARIQAGVTTRAKAKRKLLQPTLDPLAPGIKEQVTPETLKTLQGSDPTLSQVRRLVGAPAKQNKHGTVSFEIKRGILRRRFRSSSRSHNQVVVPLSLRPAILRLDHDHPVTGHMGVKRTLERARQDFYWPGMESDVRRYCQTCDACQRTTPKGRNTRVPLGKVPLVQTPFEKVGVDLKGLNGLKVANKRLTPLERRWSRELSSNSLAVASRTSSALMPRGRV
ncbi:hypothetical protein BaRGS_00035826 [Batillaria attramentaria]|uniref:Integrase zinc-binding domain-containing protein n=1 Tax=Batillaria attramentaria TaxID=370345 RepID=A0ABD0JDT3_9CAEN